MLEHCDALISKGKSIFKEISTTLDFIRQESLGTPLSVEEESKSLQLLLEFRLASQDALMTLIDLDHHLLYILGIQPQHSAQLNLERLSYALGSDDLRHILHALAQLVDALLRIARRYQRQYMTEKTHDENQSKKNRIVESLKKINQKQQQIVTLLKNSQDEIKEIIEAEGKIAVLDYIAALQGPISQFHQAILHGLSASHALYQHLNKNQLLHHEIAQLLQKTEQTLQSLPSLFDPSPHYHLGHFSGKTAKQIEENAAAKRLRPFF